MLHVCGGSGGSGSSRGSGSADAATEVTDVFAWARLGAGTYRALVSCNADAARFTATYVTHADALPPPSPAVRALVRDGSIDAAVRMPPDALVRGAGGRLALPATFPPLPPARFFSVAASLADLQIGRAHV